MILGEGRAWAACHAFTVSVSPSTVAEGATVTVTVRRDGAVAPSNVDVSTVDETAAAGSDYQALQRTVSFTTDVQQTFTVPVTNDATAEPAETFRLHLSNPGGCSINTNFSLGSDARVTVAASDTPPPATTPPTTSPPSTAPPTTQPGPETTVPRATTTTAPDQLTTDSTEPSPTTTEASSTTTSDTSDTTDTTAAATEDDEAIGEAEDGRGSGSMGAVAVIAAAVGVGALGYLLYRRRSGPAN
jgi:hypothetical protein